MMTLLSNFIKYWLDFKNYIIAGKIEETLHEVCRKEPIKLLFSIERPIAACELMEHSIMKYSNRLAISASLNDKRQIIAPAMRGNKTWAIRGFNQQVIYPNIPGPTALPITKPIALQKLFLRVSCWTPWIFRVPGSELIEMADIVVPSHLFALSKNLTGLNFFRIKLRAME